MDVRVTEKPEFVLLTDRWGNLNAHTIEHDDVTDADEDAVERLLDSMYDEVTFVARRRSDGAVGILVEAREFPHADSDDSDEEVLEGWGGTHVNGKEIGPGAIPSLADVVAELSGEARTVAEAYPGLDVSVVHGADVCAGRAVVRAFVPEGSEHMPQVEAVARRLLGEEPEAAPAP